MFERYLLMNCREIRTHVSLEEQTYVNKIELTISNSRMSLIFTPQPGLTRTPKQRMISNSW